MIVVVVLLTLREVNAHTHRRDTSHVEQLITPVCRDFLSRRLTPVFMLISCESKSERRKEAVLGLFVRKKERMVKLREAYGARGFSFLVFWGGGSNGG